MRIQTGGALNNIYLGPSSIIRSLIELGTFGHYPLFNQEWVKEAINTKKNMGKIEKLKAKEIFKILEKHRSIERQKAYITDLAEEERIIFVRFFVKIVEGKIVDKKPQLQ